MQPLINIEDKLESNGIINGCHSGVDGHMSIKLDDLNHLNHVNGTSKSLEALNGNDDDDDDDDDDEEEEEEIYVHKPAILSSARKPLIGKSRPVGRKPHGYCQRNASCIVGSVFLLTILLGFAVVVGIIVDFFHVNKAEQKYELVGCSDISIKNVWTKAFEFRTTETAVRPLHVNEDGILDVIVGYGTGYPDKLTCSIYAIPTVDDKENGVSCFGGVLALDGVTGDLLWDAPAISEIFAINCDADLNGDKWRDCVAGGRRGSLLAVNGRNGRELWTFTHNRSTDGLMNFYTAQILPDLDGDGISEVLQVHGGDPLARPFQHERLIASLIIFSGKTGKILISKPVPDRTESYMSPVLFPLSDDQLGILYGTGGEVNPGSLYLTTLDSLVQRNIDVFSQTVSSDRVKGFMVPPMIIDLNQDNYPDLIVMNFNSNIIAYDGASFAEMWRYAIPSSETYASPTPLYYNDDNIPDILINYYIGPGYPVYYYGEFIIIDGKTGKKLKTLASSNTMVISSGLNIAMEGQSTNNLLLYWLQQCDGYENDKSTFDQNMLNNKDEHEISHSLMCKIRFNTSTVSRLLAWSPKMKTIGIEIYNSNKYSKTEYNISDFLRTAEKFVKQHPEMKESFDLYTQNVMEEYDPTEADNQRKEALKSMKYYFSQKFPNQKPDLVDSSILSRLDEPTDSRYPNRDRKYLQPRQDPGYYDEYSPYKRSKRHAAPHDNEGLYRLISTGTLLPPLLGRSHPLFNHTMDTVFGVYWSQPKEVNFQTEMEKKCNLLWKEDSASRFKPNSPFSGKDLDHYLVYGARYCARKYGSKTDYSDSMKASLMFNTHIGKMTFYRKQITCKCPNLKSNQKCAPMLPFDKQPWTGYMGNNADSRWTSHRDYDLEMRL